MATGSDPAELSHLRAALGLARRALGNVWPNPAVGCVLVRERLVVGRGWTQSRGRPHAETEALARAGAEARGATAYVSLEPCSHHGKTPPCAEALIRAGIARAVVAVEDPDPRVSGAGIAALRGAGIAVELGPLAAEAAELNAGFFLRIREGRPLVTLKAATSLDGKIATHTGESRWITSEAARARGHLLRAQQDAIMVGIGTALADDPELTCRLPGMEARHPIRIVVDSHLRLSLTAKLVRSARQVPVWVVARLDIDERRRRAFQECGVEVIAVRAGGDGRPDLARVLAELGRRGLTRILVEGGGHLAASLLRAGLVDRLVWFRAACVIGGDGRPAAAGLGVDHLAEAPRFERLSVAPCGEDVMETYARVVA